MMLNPESRNAPFQPFAVMNGRRTAIPEDFVQSDVELLGQLAEEVDEPVLKARLADLSWLLKKPKVPKDAALAIDAYSKSPLDEEHWFVDGRNQWARAIVLAKSLKDWNRLEGIEKALETVFNSAVISNGTFALQIARLLLDQGLVRTKSAAIADALSSAALREEDTKDFWRARDYYASASSWFERAGNKAGAIAMTVQVAECWIKEAQTRVSGASPSYTLAASFYENAIQTYRTVPRTERNVYNVDARLDELYRLLSEAGQKSLGELGEVSTPPIDISELVKAAKDSVRGKTTPEALMAFSKLYGGASANRLRDTSIALLREYPLSALFAATHISKDGRVIAKHLGTGFGSDESEDAEQAIWAKTVEGYTREISLVVQAQIMPAYETLLQEHRLTEYDFLSMLERSPIVPTGRERLFAKGLFAGFDGDFASAIHLLVPQVENMVRAHLKAVGVKTTNIDKYGIENENSLSTLINLPEVPKIFGEDLAFELTALFCDAFGTNMRNQIAHGLLDYGECQSAQAVYVWWFVLRLTFVTFWNSMHSPQPEALSENGLEISPES